MRWRVLVTSAALGLEPRSTRRVIASYARERHVAGGAALEAARLEHELLTFNDADHAFFNDTGARFNPHAAAEAWRRTLNWFDAAD
jgi:dienelactone hydrolase